MHEFRDPSAAKYIKIISELLTHGAASDFIAGPHAPAVQFEQFLDLIAERKLSLSGARVLDFGCGAHRPLSMALLFHLCGAKQVLAVDVEPVFDIGSVAAGVLAEVIAVQFGVPKFVFEALGENKELVFQRLAALDVGALVRGDLRGGLPKSIQWRESYFESLPEEERFFDVLFSYCVFEHVEEVFCTLALLRKYINSNGYAVIVIDFKDHRVYSGEAPSWFQYLIDGPENEPGYINKIRYSEFVEIARDAGFAVEKTVFETIVPSLEERSRFTPAYAAMSDIDINTSGARILFKPV
jgi:SAM-dependent methyltransferase